MERFFEVFDIDPKVGEVLEKMLARPRSLYDLSTLLDVLKGDTPEELTESP